MDGESESAIGSSPLDYGISQVSGFYGPGSCAAWLLLVLSLFISTVISLPSGQPHPTPPSIWRRYSPIDLDHSLLTLVFPLGALDNLLSPLASLRRLGDSRLADVYFQVIAVFAFPFIAALDLMRNLDDYTTGPTLLPALFDAPFLVVRLAKVACALLMLAEAVNKLLFKPAAGRSRRLLDPSAYYPLALLFFQIVDFWAEMRVKRAERWEYVAAFAPVPESASVWVFGPPPTSAAPFVASYQAYLDALNTGRQHGILCVMSGISLGASMAWIFLVQSALGVLIRTLDLVLIMVAREAEIRVLAKGVGVWMATTIADWVFQLSISDVGLTAFDLGARGWRTLIPRSDSRWEDLDQMAALVTGGVLPLIWTLACAVMRQSAVRKPT